LRRLILLPLAGTAAILAVALVLTLAGVGTDKGFSYDDPWDRSDTTAPQGGAGAGVPGAPDRAHDLVGYLQFVANDVQTFWKEELQRAGMEYRPAQVVVFEERVRTGCGPASSATGPFYCALDQRVYLDLGFFRELAVEFHAPGDFAQAYVLAHEIGHHVQNLTGITAQVNQAMQAGVEPPNVLSIRMELQADCFAGVWGHSTYDRGLLDRGDPQEAIRAAAAVGDDRIQARTTGRINPESWTHGSSEMRVNWFVRGFDDGDPAACDTFSDGI
jgi:predicted metalloprotease